MKPPVVPQVTVSIFDSGEHCTNSLPGDMILVEHHGAMPAIIRFGQRLRYWAWRNLFRKSQYEKDFCTVNHAMIVVSGGKDALVSQMEAKGGTIVSLASYVDKKYAVVSPVNVSDEQRLSSARVGLWCEGIAYGWLSIFGSAIDCLIPVVEVALGSGQRMICSTASSLAHRCVNLIPDKSDVSVMPADLARYYQVRL